MMPPWFHAEISSLERGRPLEKVRENRAVEGNEYTGIKQRLYNGVGANPPTSTSPSPPPANPNRSKSASPTTKNNANYGNVSAAFTITINP